MKIVNKSGEKESFEDNKLFNSAYYPGLEAELDQEEAREIAEKVVWEVKSWMSEHEDNVFTSSEIRAKVLEILERENPDLALLYRTHLDLN